MKTNVKKSFLALCLLAGAVIVGAVLALTNVYPISNIGRKIINLKVKIENKQKTIETILLDLKVSFTIQIPDSQHPQGGDLASHGSEILLLTNDGLIYSIIEKDYRLLNLNAPQNNFEAYKATVQARSSQGKKHNPLNMHRLRYNGILTTQVNGVRHLLVSYIYWNKHLTCYQNAIDSTKIPDRVQYIRELQSELKWSRVYTSRPCLPLATNEADLHGHMSGGKIAVAGDGKVVLANGDFEWDGVSLPPNSVSGAPPLAQDSQSEYGKVIEIDLRDNSIKILSSGNRNMQGIAVSGNGSVWTAEHGPRGGDKLNLHKEGKNFGWPLRTYGTQYSKAPWPGALPYGRMDGYDKPAFAWMPSVAVSDISHLNGFDPSWDGDLLIGSLKAESLFRVRIEDERGTYAEQIYIGERIRSLVTPPDGKIVLWTDSNKLIFIEKSHNGWTIDKILSLRQDQANFISPPEKTRQALESCAHCHSFEPGNDTNAPSLNGLIGRKIGGSSFKFTSDSLKNYSQIWTKELLTKFLQNPNQFSPSTKMPNPGLDDATIEELVFLLSVLK